MKEGWIDMQALKDKLGKYCTTFIKNLLEIQRGIVGPCLKHSLPPGSVAIDEISPLFIEPLGESHKRILECLAESQVMLFNTSGVDKFQE